MQKKNILRFGISGSVVALSLLLLSTDRPSVPAATPVKARKSTCCKKTQACPVKMETPASWEMILENLSQQFISFSSFSY
jgi:hypothetical protein